MMTRLKLADLADEKPVRLTVELSARLCTGSLLPLPPL